MSERITDWDALERLRSLFLKQEVGPGVYWRDENDLLNYHAYFAARIGWKWDNVLSEISGRGFKVHSRRLFDWACGSGIASLRALAHWGEEAFDEVLLWDHSLLACRFAQKTILDSYPNLRVTIAREPFPSEQLRDSMALISHALNELSMEDCDRLAERLSGASQVLFVEPGDHRSSRLLIRQREAFRPDFDIVAPCAHGDRCPMLRDENAHHWCHFFGKPSHKAFTQGDWARFASMMEIDLRSLPFSCLVLNNKRITEAPHLARKASRVIGRPRQFKGYTRLLSCDAAGLRELELQKRDDKSLWKSLKKGKDGALYQWTEIEGDRIKSGKPV